MKNLGRIYRNLFLFVTVLLLVFWGYKPSNAQQPLDLGQFYDVQPDLSTCSEGTLKDAEKQKVLAEVNNIRALYGMTPVTYNSVYDVQTAKCSLIMAANETLDHQPSASYKCYSTDGFNGAGNSNLYISESFGVATPSSETSVYSWMTDDGVDVCGHRRWIINPFLKYISFGRVDGPSAQSPQFTVSTMSLYVIGTDDTQPATGFDSNFVAYPYHNFPTRYFVEDNGSHWFLSFQVIIDKSNIWNNQSTIDYSQATVTMTDQNNNQVNIDTVAFDNEGAGLPNLLRWRVLDVKTDQKYFVKINKVNVSGTMTGYSYWFNVTDATTDPPLATTLVSPQNNAQNVELTPDLQWNPSNGATNYHLQIAKDNGFTTGVVDMPGLGSTNQTTDSLADNTTWYWRVSAKNSIGESPWSPVWSFKTKSLPPKPPIVRLPADGAGNVILAAYFSWDSIPGATYNLQVATDNVFSTFNIYIDAKNLVNSSYTAKKNELTKLTTFYWRVNSVKNSVTSDWSPVRSFETEDPSGVNDNPVVGEERTKILNITPNPAGGDINITYRLADRADVSISIINMLGKSVPVPVQKSEEAGQYSIVYSTTQLPDGIYLVKLTAGGLQSEEKLIINR